MASKVTPEESIEKDSLSFHVGQTELKRFEEEKTKDSGAVIKI